MKAYWVCVMMVDILSLYGCYVYTTHTHRPLVDRDIVIWHVFGAHHVPRLEDWPMMPCEKVSCMLKPFGFFDACPVLDLAPATKRQVCMYVREERKNLMMTHATAWGPSCTHRSFFLPPIIVVIMDKVETSPLVAERLLPPRYVRWCDVGEWKRKTEDVTRSPLSLPTYNTGSWANGCTVKALSNSSSCRTSHSITIYHHLMISTHRYK